MEPITAMAAMAAIGSTVSAIGQYRQGQAAEAAGEYNAAIAERDATAATQKAEYDAEASARKFKMLQGRQRVLYSKAGVDITSGSPLLMMSFQAEEAERERQAILYGGNIASTQEKNKANMFKFQGKQAYQAGQIAAGSTFLTGLANVGTASYRWKNPTGTLIY